MRDGLSTVAACVIGLALIVAAGFALGWFSLWSGRPMAKYAEETRKEVYDTSRQYQQGTNRDVARYCEQMRTADTTAGRKAVAALIRSNLSTYDGPLTPENEACAREAGAN